MPLRDAPSWVVDKWTGRLPGFLIELFEFDLPGGTRYWSFERKTVDSQLYLPYVKDRSDVFEKVGCEQDGVTVTLFTLDGVVQDLVNAGAFYNAKFRFRFGDPTTPGRRWTYFTGRCSTPTDGTATSISVKVKGILAAHDLVQEPSRTTGEDCNETFLPIATILDRPTNCAYAGPSSTASGAGSSSTTLTPASMASFQYAVGSSIKIGAGGTPVRVIGLTTTTLLLEAARSWSSGADIFYTDCALTVPNCIDRGQMHNNSGMSGFSEVRVSLGRPLKPNGKPYSSGLVPDGIATAQHPALAPVPIIYGRRAVTLVAIEVSFWTSAFAPIYEDEDPISRDRRQNIAVFYMLEQGEAAAAPDHTYVNDKRWKIRTHEIPGSEPDRYLIAGMHYRLGAGWGVTGTESEADYIADDWALVRASHNLDFRSSAGKTYPGISHMILSANWDHDIWGNFANRRKIVDDEHVEASISIPTVRASAYGRKVTVYDDEGEAVGSPALSTNPIVCAEDFLLRSAYPPDPIDWMTNAASKACADVVIPIIESETHLTIAATAGDTRLYVRNAAGYKPGADLFLGSETTPSHTVTEPKDRGTIGIDPPIDAGELPLAIGTRVHVEAPRFELDLNIKDRKGILAQLQSFLSACRGHVRTADNKLALVIDEPRDVDQGSDGDGGTVDVHYRDVGALARRIILREPVDSFRARPRAPERQTNIVTYKFESEFRGTTTLAEAKVKDHDHLAVHPPETENYEAPGIKIRDQAIRCAKWRLNRARLLGPGCEFETGLNGLELMPDSIIKVSSKLGRFDGAIQRVLSTSFSPAPDHRLRVECEAWSNDVFTDIGNPATDSVDLGTPTLTLSCDGSSDRFFELSWVLATFAGTFAYFNIYIARAPIAGPGAPNADDEETPEEEYLVRENTQKRAFTFKVPKAWRGQTLYARVECVGLQGRFDDLISNQVSSTDAPTGTGDHVGKNLVAFSDFQDGTKWDADTDFAGGIQIDQTVKVSGSGLPISNQYNIAYVTCNDPSNLGGGATVYRTIPRRSASPETRFGKKGAWYTVAFSTSILGGVVGATYNPRIVVCFFSGPFDGSNIADPADNYQEMVSLDRDQMLDLYNNYQLNSGGGGSTSGSFARVAAHFKFPDTEPHTPGSGDYNKIGLRVFGHTQVVIFDKVGFYKGRVTLDGLLWDPDDTDQNVDNYEGVYELAAAGNFMAQGGQDTAEIGSPQIRFAPDQFI